MPRVKPHLGARLESGPSDCPEVEQSEKGRKHEELFSASHVLCTSCRLPIACATDKNIKQTQTPPAAGSFTYAAVGQGSESPLGLATLRTAAL